MELRPAGDRAILAILDRSITASQLHAAAESASRIPDVIACVPGHSSLLTAWRGVPDPVALRAAIASADSAALRSTARHHRLKVSFRDGADLEEFLARQALTFEAFANRVARLRLTARYLGFRAGFAYLDGWPEEWAMPRRPTSRPAVAAGSFAIAGTNAGFYPIDSPGGWNLLGRTDAVLWDEHRQPPNLIAAGDTIEIHPTLEEIPLRPVQRPAMARLELPFADVLAAPLAVVVRAPDWSRVASGSAVGGPFDPRAAAHANAAVGNAQDAPLLECAMAGPRLRMRTGGVLSWFGAGAEVRINGDLAADARCVRVRAGDEVAIGRLTRGLRGYLAFGAAEGSVGDEEGDHDRLHIRAIEGPHGGLAGRVECVVTPQLDRVGIRLRPDGVTMPAIPADLPSCGMQFGTVQLHPDGTLVAMGPDHPVTGGYLQPMTVVSADLWKLGQLAPGERAVFEVEPSAAI